MEFLDLSLTDKSWFAPHLMLLGEDLSEYSFSNLFLFRDKHRYRLVKEGGYLFVLGHSYDGLSFLMPTVDLTEASVEVIHRLLHQLKEINMIFPLPESALSFFPSNQFRLEVLHSDMDYLFTREKLRDFPGRHLHGKRNLAKQFRENYAPVSIPLDSPDRRKAALSLLSIWQENSSLDPHDTDFYACKEALQFYEELSLEGFLIMAGKEPAGFSLGEGICPSVYGLHFAKADKKFKGVYQYLFSETARLIDSRYQWLNLEQDLGSVALRAAKSSYRPDKMGKKYRAFLKK